MFDKNGKAVEAKVTLSDAVWAVPMNKDLVVQAVNVYLFNQRKFSADTKTRGEVSGGGRKPWKQKGTGRARQGSIRSPLWRGGGIVFGPHLHKVTKDLPKKMSRLAMKCVLSEKVGKSNVRFVEELSVPKEKSTAAMSKMLSTMKLENEKVMIVVGSKSDQIVRKSAANLSSVKVTDAKNLNIGDLMKSKVLVIDANSVKEIEERLK